VQVGGGALATGLALGFDEAAALGVSDRAPTLDTIQTVGGWPLARAHARLLQDLGAEPGDVIDEPRVQEALRVAARHRARYMRPWESVPHSIAHGILDDETYDWLAVTRAMLRSGGRALVVDDAALVEANAVSRQATGVEADETGTAGVAGLLALGAGGHLAPSETVAVVLTGARRTSSLEE
jgi:threonine synthase